MKTKEKRKQNFAVGPLERIGDSQTCPWPEPGTEEAAAGRISASPAGGGEGEQGEEQEGGESNLLVGSDRVGGGRRRRRHRAAAPAEVARGGGGAPAKGSGRGRAGELHGAMGDLFSGLARAEEGRRWGLGRSGRPAAAMV